METYIATFFSHFGAVRFGRQLREAGIDCALMPVPRQVSSSCGTCVRFTAKPPPPLPAEGDWDCLFCQVGNSYMELQSNL